VVAVSAPHRDVAFEAARWIIDTVKSSVPVWKQETWAGGQDWGSDAQAVGEIPLAAGAPW
jgi:molybdopterin synthase catalytic subunit